MLERYKLRLGDGTVLMVDHDGLSTWLMDDKAMVQGARNSLWQPLKDFLAEERLLASYAARKKAAARDDLPAPLPTPRERALMSQPEPPAKTPPPRQPAEAPVAVSPASPPVPAPPSFDAPPDLLVLADDPGSRAAEPAREPSAANDEIAIIPLKPLDDEPPPPPALPPELRPAPIWERRPLTEAPRDPRLAGLLRGLGSFSEALLAWWSDGLARVVSRLARGSSRAASPRAHASPWAGPSPEPRPAAHEDPRAEAPLMPPPSLEELPVLRLAEIDETRDTGDVYEGDSAAGAAWLWARRVVLVAALAAGVVFAATTWRDWLPRALELGPMLFTQLDSRTGARDPQALEQRALEQATEQLPQLAPETIRRVLSGSVTGALEPAEVFRLAGNAEALGMASLPASEAQELAALRGKLLDSLTPAERERVREHDAARARRPLYTFEDRAVVGLLARGARALAPDDLARLRSLSARAVAAGLSASARAEPAAAGRAARPTR